MEVISAVSYMVVGVLSIGMQGCCWWSCFKCLGCIDSAEDKREKERLRQQEAHVIDSTKWTNNNKNINNPFINPEARTDEHLMSAY